MINVKFGIASNGNSGLIEQIARWHNVLPN